MDAIHIKTLPTRVPDILSAPGPSSPASRLTGAERRNRRDRIPRSSVTRRGMPANVLRPKRTPGVLGGEHQPSRAPRRWRHVAIVQPTADLVLVPAHFRNGLRCLLAAPERYFASPDFDQLADRTNYRIAGLWLDNAEYTAMMAALCWALEPRFASATEGSAPVHPRKGGVPGRRRSR